ncbi:hypothetical protein BKA25_001546 [Actinoalloteichus hymeniacidonis]|nr:hypothetical protein [Actinoalloteichus hymeniacidonis]
MSSGSSVLLVLLVESSMGFNSQGRAQNLVDEKPVTRQ